MVKNMTIRDIPSIMDFYQTVLIFSPRVKECKFEEFIKDEDCTSLVIK